MRAHRAPRLASVKSIVAVALMILLISPAALGQATRSDDCVPVYPAGCPLQVGETQNAILDDEAAGHLWWIEANERQGLQVFFFSPNRAGILLYLYGPSGEELGTLRDLGGSNLLEVRGLEAGRYALVVQSAIGDAAFGRYSVQVKGFADRLAPVGIGAQVAAQSQSAGILSISAGFFHSVAIEKNGSVVAWGDNTGGRLGDGTMTGRLIPVPVALPKVESVDAGLVRSLAVDTTGSVWEWGLLHGGDSCRTGLSEATAIPILIDELPPAVAAAAGDEHSLVLAQDATVWSWGQNQQGQLGAGSYTCRGAPAQIDGLPPSKVVAAGKYHSLALATDGSVWAWGGNGNGQLGDGTTDNRPSPRQVGGLQSIADVRSGQSHSVALGTGGRVWTWGSNYTGDASEDRLIPVQVDGLPVIRAIDAGAFHTLALALDGSVWAWGLNEGALGNGGNDFRNRVDATKVQGIPPAREIAAGGRNSFAIALDGTVWGWGWNENGELGNGTRGGFSRPVPATGT